MDYSLRKACRMIWQNKGIYLLLFLEMAVGIFLFSYCLNITMSCDDTVRKIDEGIGEDSIQLSYLLTGATLLPDGFPVSAKSIEELRNNTAAKGLVIQYLPYVQHTIVFSDTGETANIYVVFADKENGVLSGFDNIPKEGYIGSNAAAYLRRYRTLSEQGLASSYSSLTLSTDTIAFGNTWSCSLTQLLPMDTALEKQTFSYSYSSVFSEEQFSLSDCILLPFEQIDMLAHAQGLGGRAVIQFFLRDWSGDWNLFIDFVNKLSASRTDYSYSLAQQSVSLHMAAEDNMIPYRTSLWQGISVLAITTSGMIGVFILLLHRREKTNAVAVACGATYGRLLTELLAEVGSVTFAGTCIGIICSIPPVLRVKIYGFFTGGTIHLQAILGCLIIWALSSLIICGSAMLIVRRRQLAEVLKAA